MHYSAGTDFGCMDSACQRFQPASSAAEVGRTGSTAARTIATGPMPSCSEAAATTVLFAAKWADFTGP